MANTVINVSQQDLQVMELYETEGLSPDTIGEALGLTPTIVRTSLMTNSAVFRRAYNDGTEDIPDEVFEKAKDVVAEIAFDRGVASAVRLSAAKYIWDRKRPPKQVLDTGIAEFAKVLGDGILAARDKSRRILESVDVVVDEIPKKPRLSELHTAVTNDIAKHRNE